MNSTQTVADDEIARRAYEIWESRGRPQSDGRDEWHAAKAELIAARISRRGTTQDRMQTWWQRVREKLATAMQSNY